MTTDHIRDPYGLMDDSKSILERLHTFEDRVIEMGYDLHTSHGGLPNEHFLSQAFAVPPQIVRMYFELRKCSDDERRILLEKNLDTGVIRTLMLLHPVVRTVVYEHLDDLLKGERPLSNIIDFVENGNWRLRIRDLYDRIDREYWAAVSSLLKDKDIVNGTITKRFRSLLMTIKRHDASESQLMWLERAIIHDFELGLGVFTSPALQKEYPEAVAIVKDFLDEYRHFDLLEDV